MGISRLKKYDRFVNGFTLGILSPLLIFLVIYLFRYIEIPLGRFIYDLQEMKILVKLLSLFGFANLLIFLWFYRSKMDKAARGVIAATIIYAVLVLISRLLH